MMKLGKRVLSLVLSAVLLLAPVVSPAEEITANYPAGELTTTVIADSYYAGNQLELNAVLGLDLQNGFGGEKAKALADLLSRGRLHMSFYDDFGTAIIRAAVSLEDVNLLTADVLVYEDGSVQMMTNLTGKYVLALPAGSVVNGMVNVNAFGTDAAEIEYDMSTPEGIAAFNALPATDRLKRTSSDMISLVLGHLLGWVSYAQMDSDGQLYVFDDTYLDATDTRDAVAQRMIGTIEAHRFNTLFQNIVMTVCDDCGDFQQALADVLAQNGVTRYQVRQFVDALLTQEEINPSLDWVQPSHAIEDDGALCEYDDISYFFKKLFKCSQRIWENSTDNVLHMDVSYDDFGGMVGFDADMPQFTTLLPYEGDFTYSIKTDDYWQRMHTAHGEMQIYNDQRLVGDLAAHNGEDVGGVNTSSLNGYLDVVNQGDKTSAGVGLDGALDFEVIVNEDGSENEEFAGSLTLRARQNGEGTALAGASFSGLTTVDTAGFGTTATAALSFADAVTLVADVTLEQTEYEEMTFSGGEALDLTALDEAMLNKLAGEVKNQAAKLGMSLVLKQGVLSSVMTLIGE